MRKKKGSVVDGWLILDKPRGMTSTDAVNRVKRLFQAQKAGHAGTLDPLATGILPIAFGEATKTVPFVVDGQKHYRFTVTWGSETDTDDSEGQTVRRSDERPSRADIESALLEFRGEIQQVPPQFSAVKVAGARAYDLARDGESFALAARTVLVRRLDIANVPFADTCIFDAFCGKGTYIRSLARDIGRRLGCFGHVTELRRVSVGALDLDSAISLDKLEELGHSAPGREGLRSVLRPVEAALDDIPALSVSTSDAARLRRGQAILIRGATAPILTGPAYAMSHGALVAVGEVRQGEFHPARVFNLSERQGGPPSIGSMIED